MILRDGLNACIVGMIIPVFLWAYRKMDYCFPRATTLGPVRSLFSNSIYLPGPICRRSNEKHAPPMSFQDIIPQLGRKHVRTAQYPISLRLHFSRALHAPNRPAVTVPSLTHTKPQPQPTGASRPRITSPTATKTEPIRARVPTPPPPKKTPERSARAIRLHRARAGAGSRGHAASRWSIDRSIH
jgi:hypothetical protein